MDAASNNRAYAQSVHRWRKGFAWASIVFSFILSGVVQWSTERPRSKNTSLDTNQSLSLADEAAALAKTAEEAAALAKTAEEEAARARVALWGLAQLSSEATREKKTAEEEAARAEAKVIITRDHLKTVLSDLLLRETSAVSEAERERLRAQIELLIGLLGKTSVTPADGDRTDSGPGAMAANRYGMIGATSAPFMPMLISAGALAVSLLGFLSTTFMAWRVDRRAMRTEARAEEEHGWKKNDRDVSPGFGL